METRSKSAPNVCASASTASLHQHYAASGLYAPLLDNDDNDDRQSQGARKVSHPNVKKHARHASWANSVVTSQRSHHAYHHNSFRGMVSATHLEMAAAALQMHDDDVPPGDGALPLSEDIYPEKECGIFACRPGFMQQFANVKMFVFLLSLLVTLQQALASGYLNSVITTIEKRYEIPSSLSGLVASTYEIGNVVTVIFVSYLGSRRHIPVWIGVGALVTGIGSMVFSVPHFLSDDYALEAERARNTSESNDICRIDDLGVSRPVCDDKSVAPSSTGPLLLFMLGQLLLGCGGSPLFTLGTTYIDDHVTRENSSMYMGVVYSMAAFGPVCGFLLGAYLLSFYVDMYPASGGKAPIEHNDVRWVGMWWGGFLLCGACMVIMSVPFFAFPKKLKRDLDRVLIEEKNKEIQRELRKKSRHRKTGSNASNEVTTSNRNSSNNLSRRTSKAKTYGKDVKGIPSSMLHLVKNPIYVVTCLGACMELVIVSGFVIFLPKYLETQFTLSKSQASVFTGGIAIPGACVGIFMGGYLLKRMQLQRKGAVQFILLCNLLCLACYALLLFLGCDNIKMAGATEPYYSGLPEKYPDLAFRVNLTAACNTGCECGLDDVRPVCGNDGLTYFSPCHAGCTTLVAAGQNYTNCACIHGNLSSNNGVRPNSATAEALVGGAVGGLLHTSSSAASGIAGTTYAEVTVVPVATVGQCASPCHTILPFMVLLFFMTFVVAVTQMPLLTMVLRSVSPEERSFALGMQFVIFRLFGYIPSPIMFGNIIDSTCLLWKQSNVCGSGRRAGGRCLLYDIEEFRHKYVGICAGIKVTAFFLFAFDWYLIRRKQREDELGPVNQDRGCKSSELQPVSVEAEIVQSVVSLDKLFEQPHRNDAGNNLPI